MNDTEIKTSFAEVMLKEYIREHGPIKTARVSSAQARGAAKKYCYWDAVRYEVRINQKGRLVNRPLERASSHRRSTSLVQRDLDELCEREDRIELNRIGALGDYDILDIYEKLFR